MVVVRLVLFLSMMCVPVLFSSTLKLNIGQLSTSFDLKWSLLNVNILKLELSVRDRYMIIRISKQRVQLDIVETHIFET